MVDLPPPLLSFPEMTPTDLLDNTFSFRGFIRLAPGDSIAALTLTTDVPGLSFSSVTFGKETVTFWAQGALNTYTITCTITTAQGRKAARSATLTIQAPLP